MSQVNLDALISRQDMFVREGKTDKSNQRGSDDFRITDLEQRAFFFNSLRKPDFQRETSDWTPEKVCDFIESFVNGDLIPSVIMWSSGTYNFVIDGAHRISALVAWVLDDYGDGILSQPFFDNEVDEGIRKLAEKTRTLVNKRIGTYQRFVAAMQNPNSDKKITETALRFGILNIKLQWVEGTAEVAEKSFFKINESATPINETEKELLKARRKPNAIAARAIIHAGSGHRYWDKFSSEKMLEIENLAKEINEILFTPKYETPIKTLDLPLGGKGYSGQTLELIFDLVNLSNGIRIEDKKRPEDRELDDDETGEVTVTFLTQTKKLLSRMTGNISASLGLHPAVYFYSNSGRYQVTAFMAWIELIKDFELRKGFKEFIDVRSKYEDFLVSHKEFIHQIVLKFGSGVKSYRRLERYFKIIITQFQDGKNEQQIIDHLLQEQSEFNFLRQNQLEVSPTKRATFSPETKSMVYIREAFANPIRCGLCGGYIHTKGIQIDHIERKKDGGIGHVDNGQLTHPYCNSIKS